MQRLLQCVEHEGGVACTDQFCRPLAFLRTGGQVADCKAGAQLLGRVPKCWIMLTDKGYGSDATRWQIGATVAVLNIPPKFDWRRKPYCSPVLSEGGNAIERMFGRLSGGSESV